ncbi:MAG: hypothetical protein AB1758_20905, partial [Candidatus Eremiobacterota bacterium]
MSTATTEALRLDLNQVQSPDEPDWMTRLRAESLEGFQTLPFPTSQWESWRRTPPEKFHPGARPWAPVLTRTEGAEALSDVLKARPDEVRRDFMAAVPQDDAFVRLNGAFWSNGGFVQIPKDHQADRPIRVDNRVEQGGAAFPHSLVRAGRFSRAVVIETFRSSEEDTLAVPVVEIQVEAGARLDYLVVHQWGSRTRYLPILRA